MNRSQRGVSLIEALVAMGVMAFGMLGVVGMQATLRTNADTSKQRAEAVRVAQAAVEDWRAFAVLDTTVGAPPAWADIVSISGGSSAHYTSTNTNTVYTIDATVVTPAANAPKLKTFDLTVSWADRNAPVAGGVARNNQSVQLVGAIARIAPELAGSLALPGNQAPTQQPGPRKQGTLFGLAVNQNDGTSHYTPAPTVANPSPPTFVFSNYTGLVTSLCSPFPSGCVAVSAQVSGYVRFATGSTQPTAALAENPPAGIPLPVGVDVGPLAIPLSPGFTPQCAAAPISNYVAYACAIPAMTSPPYHWSGQANRPTVYLTGLALAAAMSDASAALYKVCRYTEATGHATSNADHPLVYTNVTTPLWNQNFLVIRAGDGSTAFGCPGDDPSTPVNSNTYPHQPQS